MPDSNPPVPPTTSVTMRLPLELVTRLDELVKQLTSATPHARVTRTSVAVRAMELGIEEMARGLGSEAP